MTFLRRSVQGRAAAFDRSLSISAVDCRCQGDVRSSQQPSMPAAVGSGDVFRKTNRSNNAPLLAVVAVPRHSFDALTQSLRDRDSGAVVSNRLSLRIVRSRMRIAELA